MVKNISVKPNQKSAFISVLIWGMFANIYMFTNKISFHDDMGALFGVGTTYASGRWLLGILGDLVKKFYGNYSLPVLGGFLSLFFIALAAIILVDVFEIHSRVNSILAGAIMVLFPAVVSVFAYMYTAPYYYFALLLCL